MLAGLAFMSLQTLALLFGLRFVVEYDSVYFTAFSVVLSVVLFVVMMWLYVNWLLVNVVVVSESKWGFQALVRSWYLLKGMRSVAVKLIVFYGVLEGCLVLVYSRSVIGYGVGSWAFILNVVFGSGFLMLLMLQSCVANVVLYNYCKAIHGELVIDVGDYVGLSADDDKVPVNSKDTAPRYKSQQVAIDTNYRSTFQMTESKWGFGALMRSSYLVKGMRSASLLLLLYFGTFSALLVWVFRDSPHEFSSWMFVFYAILGSSFLIWLLLHSTVANTVLYNYCKALHGELAIEIAEGFDHEYTNLSHGDVKVPHAVTEVTV
uniref:1,4-dihydroxy-2-naphthoate polyprenyltransferase n=1 Tax=Tanacetum cinerariifolium TaxID=118510 RepID=A0A6L2P4X4_TANCI|nr:1,4-dihydroxy-2-naphthoate polyprenyltransferase [Tanacetum cinerariifolium]